MSPDEPRSGLGDDAAHFSAYLSFYRETLIDGVLGLPAEGQRTSRVPSDWTPIELLSHVLHMEQRWFVWRFLGEDVAEPLGDWLQGSNDEDSRWHVPDTVTAEDLAARARAIGERTAAILAGHDLAEHAAEIRGDAETHPLDLRWICFHVLQEYARHAGHLDIVVELAPSSTS